MYIYFASHLEKNESNFPWITSGGIMINDNKSTFEPHASHNPIIEQQKKLVLVWLSFHG